MRNIRYIGNSAVNKAYYQQTGIIWTPGKVDTVLDDKVAAEMLLHPDVFEDAGDSTAVPDGADNALALTDTGLTKGGLALTSSQAAVMRAGLGIVTLTQAAYDALTPPDANTLYVIVG